MKKFGLLAQISDKFGTVGVIVATMGCAMCFPAHRNCSRDGCEIQKGL